MNILTLKEIKSLARQYEEHLRMQNPLVLYVEMLDRLERAADDMRRDWDYLCRLIKKDEKCCPITQERGRAMGSVDTSMRISCTYLKGIANDIRGIADTLEQVRPKEISAACTRCDRKQGL